MRKSSVSFDEIFTVFSQNLRHLFLKSRAAFREIFSIFLRREQHLFAKSIVFFKSPVFRSFTGIGALTYPPLSFHVSRSCLAKPRQAWLCPYLPAAFSFFTSSTRSGTTLPDSASDCDFCSSFVYARFYFYLPSGDVV